MIFRWRVDLKLSIPAIVSRLTADPAAYPTPDGKPGWTRRGVTALLSNPKYTGHMVYGRTRAKAGRKPRPVPADQWIWTPEPVHPAIVDRDTWDAAQKTGAERGNVAGPGTPTRYGHRYILRSRLRCRLCQRRMCGIYKDDHAGGIRIYYRCPHDHANPRHRAAHPDHPTVSVREDAMMAAIVTFFDQYVFGHDRAALLAAQLPATAAGHADQQARQEAHLRAELARIDTAERALIAELEAPADPADPAAQAYRARIRERYAQRTQTEAQLAALHDAAPHDHDPALLDALPLAAAAMAAAPDRIKQALITAFDIQALYNNDMNQVTIWASLTDDTPRTVTALLTDPRTDHDTGPAPPAPNPATQRYIQDPDL